MDEWAEESGSGEVLEVGARFGQPAERSRVRDDSLSLREGVTWSKAMARRDDELLPVQRAVRPATGAVSQSPERSCQSAGVRSAPRTISVPDPLSTTRSTEGRPSRTEIGSSCLPSHWDSWSTWPRSSNVAISTAPAGWVTAAQPGKVDPSAHSMKKGSDGWAADCSRAAVRQRNIRPSGVTLDPPPMGRPSLCATSSRSLVRTAQPNGLELGPASTAATQCPKSLRAASSSSTTATSSR